MRSNPWTGGAAVTNKKNVVSKKIVLPKLRSLARKEHPSAFFVTLQKKLSAACYFGEIIGLQEAKFAQLVGECNAECGTNVSVADALSMRSPIIIDLTIKVHVRMQHNIGELTARYLGGESVVDIAKGECYAPVALYKRILCYRGVSEAVAKMVTSRLTDRADLEKHLTSRDIDELYSAWQHDSMNPRSIAQSALYAEQQEAKFVEWFATQGVAFQTQKQLAEQQTAEEGRPVCTPDILITGVYEVNGVRIYWVDFKNYMGCPLPYLQRGCQEQAAKYTKRWGRGAFCFEYGVVAGFHVPLLGQNDSDPLLLSLV